MNRLCGIALFMLPVVAGAQTCATPIAMANKSTLAGNTCSAPKGTGANSLAAYGGTPSPQNEVVYSFVAQDASTNIAIADDGKFGAAVFLMPGPCGTSTDPVALGYAGTPMVATGLTKGQTYYVIVAADPSGKAAACGAYSLTISGKAADSK
jgi:hypothetical protein